MASLDSSVMPTYNRFNVSFERGSGCWLWDTDGNKYLDSLSGIAVCGLGHAHPKITQAISDQAASLIHTSNLFGIPEQEKLASKLTSLSHMDNVFFANSGAEANEAAIKITRLYGRSKNIKNPVVVVMEDSFHGRTMATLTATGNRSVQKGFDPLLNGFLRVPYDDIDTLQQISKNNPNVVAVMVEPILGENGIKIPQSNYLNKLRDCCDDNQWLLILDEIQTGMGRSGLWFSHQHQQICPDVMTLAKGLGNGFPIGACLAKGVASTLLTAGFHGSTFGGNPLACRVANTVIDVTETDNLLEMPNNKDIICSIRLKSSYPHLNRSQTFVDKAY